MKTLFRSQLRCSRNMARAEARNDVDRLATLVCKKSQIGGTSRGGGEKSDIVASRDELLKGRAISRAMTRQSAAGQRKDCPDGLQDL
ncbi:hypothetical protein RRG08_050939 [Elysia crispata]|uniref:Uncharacterized protein n=1 Tax=Elysia crispata TaxID=231223 RepID=A0AAE0YQK8_9GAST|nr:hypothetical protein RRG08_050939 [Elysia crispata]